jgi:hypothetical protein
VHADRNHTLDDLGIAKTAREEKTRARDAKLKQDAENAKMMALYKQHVLGEKAPEVGGFVSLDNLAKPAAAPVEKKEEEVMGD